MKSSEKDVFEIIQEAYWHLSEHNYDYHHITPQELLDKLKKLLDDEGLASTTSKERKRP